MAKFPRQYEWICNIEFLTEARLRAFKSCLLHLLKVFLYAMVYFVSILLSFCLWGWSLEELVPLSLQPPLWPRLCFSSRAPPRPCSRSEELFIITSFNFQLLYYIVLHLLIKVILVQMYAYKI